jgi:uncharacterized protein YaiI (UPF0178 family)
MRNSSNLLANEISIYNTKAEFIKTVSLDEGIDMVDRGVAYIITTEDIVLENDADLELHDELDKIIDILKAA